MSANANEILLKEQIAYAPALTLLDCREYWGGGL